MQRNSTEGFWRQLSSLLNATRLEPTLHCRNFGYNLIFYWSLLHATQFTTKGLGDDLICSLLKAARCDPRLRPKASTLFAITGC